jgi:hypothetical protein
LLAPFLRLQPFGEQTLTCGSDGKWDHPAPSCSMSRECSHTKCSLVNHPSGESVQLISVRHHNLESHGSRHRCSTKAGKCTCKCWDQAPTAASP